MPNAKDYKILVEAVSAELSEGKVCMKGATRELSPAAIVDILDVPDDLKGRRLAIGKGIVPPKRNLVVIETKSGEVFFARDPAADYWARLSTPPALEALLAWRQAGQVEAAPLMRALLAQPRERRHYLNGLQSAAPRP